MLLRKSDAPNKQTRLRSRSVNITAKFLYSVQEDSKMSEVRKDNKPTPKITPAEFLSEQKKTKPKIESVVNEHLCGVIKDNALDFITYLRENKFNPNYAGMLNAWKVTYKGRTLCYIRLFYDDMKAWSPHDNDTWVVSLYLEHLNRYEDTLINENMQNVLWDNIRGYCTDGCPSTKEKYRPCFPGVNITLLGKEFKRVCACYPHIWTWNPNKSTLNSVKRILELERQARATK